MFNFPKGRSGNSRTAPSLDAVRFDTTNCEDQGEIEPGRVHSWLTPEGDALRLHFFPLQPDLPAKARTLNDVHAFFTELLVGAPAHIVELSLVRAGECLAVRLILKAPQQPSGLCYLGSLTIPFRDFSFVIKVQCEELGTTGVREAILMAEWLKAGKPIPFKEGQSPHPDWQPDNEKFDGEFPWHPVPRVRRTLNRVAETLAIEAGVRSLPGFPLPASGI